jgi:nucleoside-diphosphate-sugar epimerase
MKHILITGGSGLVGRGAMRHFAALDGSKVTGVSRRTGEPMRGAAQQSLDLCDREACRAFVAARRDITHLVFAALNEKEGALFEGWHDLRQMEKNATMLRNILDPLIELCADLEHVVLMQGTKAYGAHVGETPIPARENTPRHRQANFYFMQEDYLRERQIGMPWSWTVLRPQLVIGEAIGANLNLLLAVCVYAALLRERGEPLYFPGDHPQISEVIDVEILAKAIAWCGEAHVCRNEIYNLANGDVFTLKGVWRVIAESMGMQVGEDRPVSIAKYLIDRDDEWRQIVQRHALRAPESLKLMLGESAVVADFFTGFGAPSAIVCISSSVKARQAGFHDCADTEDMFRKWIARYQESRLLPARHS